MPQNQVDTTSIANAAVMACADAFIAFDGRGIVRLWNPAAARLFGYTAAEVVGQPDPTVAVFQPELFTWADAVLGGGHELASTVSERTHRDGRVLPCRVHGHVRIGTAAGPILGFFLRELGAGERLLDLRNRVSGEFAQANHREEVLEVALRAIGDGVEARGAVVLVPERDRLRGIVGIGVEQAEVDLISLPANGDRAWVLAQRGLPTLGQLTVGPLELAETLFVAMGPRDRGWVLAILTGANGLGTDHYPIAQALADEIASGLQRSWLIRDLEDKLEILEATRAVARRAGVDVGRVADSICQLATNLLSCERTAIYLQTDTGLTLTGGVDIATENDGRRFASMVLERGGTVVVQDASASPYADGPWSGRAGAVSVMGTPLRVRDQVVGVLVVAHTDKAPRGFTALCQEVGQAASAQAAMALEHARLFAAEQLRVRELRALQVDRMTEVAGLVHDLRTPLTGLLGFSQTLRRMGDRISEEQRDVFTEAMERQSRRLIAMVDDVLLASRLEHGHLEPEELVAVSVSGLVASALSSYEPDRRSRVLVQGDDAAMRVCGDPRQLERVVHNLVDNALKYSDARSQVDLTVASVGDDEVEISVRDHGVGIARDQVPFIFERYRRGTEGETATTSFGLGLYVVKGIVERHGGTIECASDLGQGTTFTVRLPGSRDCPDTAV